MTKIGELGSIDTQLANIGLAMRDNKVMIRLNDGEKKLLDDAASRLDTPTSSWARSLLIRAAKSELYEVPPRAKNGKDKSPPLLSLFCGPGGLDQGFKEAGFHTALAFDNDDECVRTFNANHGNAYVRDINAITLDELDSLNGGEFKPVGVVGGPPCQGFSVSNVHQKDDDPRHQLPEAYANLLGKLNERNPISFFLFENVPGLLGKRHIQRYLRFKNMFEKAGFDVFEDMLDAKHYGVPQERERIFIVGINRDLHPDCEWIRPKTETKVKTVRDTIEGLPEPIYNERGLNPDTFPVHPNHWCLVPRSKKFISADLKEGQAWGRSFRTLYWDKPSWAVAYGHREVHVHPNGHRRLSMYEAMLLQTFPHKYRLTGNMTAQIRLVSEAVPVRLARHIARSIRRTIDI